MSSRLSVWIKEVCQEQKPKTQKKKGGGLFFIYRFQFSLKDLHSFFYFILESSDFCLVFFWLFFFGLVWTRTKFSIKKKKKFKVDFQLSFSKQTGAITDQVLCFELCRIYPGNRGINAIISNSKDANCSQQQQQQNIININVWQFHLLMLLLNNTKQIHSHVNSQTHTHSYAAYNNPCRFDLLTLFLSI